MNTNDTLILTGQGYNLTITDEALNRRQDLLDAATTVTTVTDNDESSAASRHVRNLAALRIEVDKCRKEIKEPVIRIGKLIDTTAKEFLLDIEAQEARIKGLIGDHALEVAKAKAEVERKEREAFAAARGAREALEAADTIANVIAANQARSLRMAASDEVAATKVAQGVRFAWDFEVDDMKLLASVKPDFVEMTARRSVILAWIKALDAGEVEDVDMHCFAAGIRAFKKPVISTK